MKTKRVNIIITKVFPCFYLGLNCFLTQSTMAESVKKNQGDRAISLPLSSVSTQDLDLLLLPSLSDKSDFDLIPVRKLAQRKLDLAQFCQNYPYNSQCSGKTQSNEPTKEAQTATTLSVEQTSQSKSGWAVVPAVSTLGVGGNVVREITSKFNARVGVNAFGQDININETEYDYKGNLNLFNVSTLLDVQPFKQSGFRLSAGLIFGNNNIQGTADVSERVADELGEVKIGGQTIDIRDLNIEGLASIDTDIEINEGVSPYLGIGGGNAVKAGKGLGFWWDLGVVFSGSPEATVTSNFSTEIPAELRDEVVAAADEALKDEEKDLNQALDVMGVYPVLSFGLSYQF